MVESPAKNPTALQEDLQKDATTKAIDSGPKGSTFKGRHVGRSSKASTGAVDLMALKTAGDQELFSGIQSRALTTGEPFDGVLASQIEAICGAPLSKAGLRPLYANCLPNTYVVLTGVEATDDTFGYMVSWLDHDGKEVACAGRNLKRHEDGSLELHCHTVWVDPDLRGHAVSAKAMRQEIAMLQALSPNERTCLSLRAGGMCDVNDNKAFQNIRAYAWANFGFDFSDKHGIETFGYYGPRCDDDEGASTKLSDLQLMRRKFSTWVDGQVAEGNIPNNPKVAAKLKEASTHWRKPWHVSTFAVPGLRFESEIGGKKVTCDIGKAFLTSGQAINWDGAFLVNRPTLSSAKIAAAYTDQAIEQSARRDSEERAALATALRGDDRAATLHAIKRIARLGGDEWSAALLRLRREEPEFGDVVSAAMQRIAGEGIEAGLRRAAGDGEAESSRRLQAVALLCETSGRTEWTLKRHLFAGLDKLELRQAVELLARREIEANPADVAHELDLCLNRPETPGWFGRTMIVKVLAYAGEAGEKVIEAWLPKEEGAIVLSLLVGDIEALDQPPADLLDAIKARREVLNAGKRVNEGSLLDEIEQVEQELIDLDSLTHDDTIRLVELGPKKK